MKDEEAIASVYTQHDITKQVTAPTPLTKPANKKSLNRVPSEKETAEKTRLAHEAQKWKAEEAISAGSDTGDTAGVLSTTKWLIVASIIVSLFGLCDVTLCKYVTPSHQHLLHSTHNHVISIPHICIN